MACFVAFVNIVEDVLWLLLVLFVVDADDVVVPAVVNAAVVHAYRCYVFVVVAFPSARSSPSGKRGR